MVSYSLADAGITTTLLCLFKANEATTEPSPPTKSPHLRIGENTLAFCQSVGMPGHDRNFYFLNFFTITMIEFFFIKRECEAGFYFCEWSLTKRNFDLLGQVIFKL